MDYLKHYNSLIVRARNRVLEGYMETHHVLPKCLGGADNDANLVCLTPEEHYTAHLLLVKIYPGVNELVFAANMMTVSSKTMRRSNKSYGWLKRLYQQVCKTRTGDMNPSYGKPWYIDPNTGATGKFIPGEHPPGWILGRVIGRSTTSCVSCGNDTQMKAARFCDACRKQKLSTKKNRNIKATKVKDTFSDAEKMQALTSCGGNIRKALFSLGLSDGGTHYKSMKELKASLYPLATNQLKG